MINPKRVSSLILLTLATVACLGCGRGRTTSTDDSAKAQTPTASLVSNPSGAADTEGGRYALLVGVTSYDHLGRSWNLEGPGNDIRLVKTLLTERFAFPQANIVTLAEDEGKPELRPTRANIKREFDR